jgi:hypothetical protein
MANLAIKGHATRGKEVIEILEMLGGINELGLEGTEDYTYYYIDDSSNNIYCVLSVDPNDYNVYTLEEFEKKYPYKVGDEVLVTYFEGVWKIIEILWSESLDIIHYGISNGKSKELVRVEDLKSFNEFRLNDNFKGQNKEEKTFPPYMDYDVKSNKEQEDITEPKELLIGFIKDNNGDWVINTHKDYEIKEVDGKFKLVKKQPKYPKTFIEVLNFWHPDRQIEDDYQRHYKKDLIEKFQDLLYARDAYWKIAGEEMGLGKPWKPDWNHNTEKYIISPYQYLYSIDKENYRNTVLAFPTKEMRDAFYNNFKDLIEKCKELL